MNMRATKHFQYGLLLSTPKEKKRISKKHTDFFWSFWFSEESKTRTRKTIYIGKVPTSKKKNKKSFWVFILISTTSMEIKLTNFFGFS